MFVDLNLMRRNMVNWQLLPNNIDNPRLITAYSELPRENFVGPQDAARAYADASMVLQEGRHIIRPLALAKLIQWLAPESAMKVLDVGAGYGYASALLSFIVREVVALEDTLLFPALKDHIDSADIPSIHAVCNSLDNGAPAEAPFDAILIAYEVDQVPPKLFDQLKEGGRLITCIKVGEMAKSLATLYTKGSHGVTSVVMGELPAPHLNLNLDAANESRFTF